MLVLIAPEGSSALTASVLKAAREALTDQGVLSFDPVWLSPGKAADVPFALRETMPSLQTGPSLEKASAAWAGLPIDAGIVEIEGRRKGLLVADMDSTMIEVECIDEIADALGLKDRVATITERAMAGEIPFDGALRDRVALLEGLEEARLEEIYSSRIRFTPGGRTLVRTMAAHGATTALVSGGFTYFTDRVGAALGFHHTRANVLEIGDDGRLTGRVLEPIQGREAKREALLAFAAGAGLTERDALALGDGANDLAMIGVAGLGIAFRATPAVAAAADIAVNHADLTAPLYIQGYREEEIVRD